VGAYGQQDTQGRFILYRKKVMIHEFLTARYKNYLFASIYEKIVLLQSAYQGTEEMGKVQDVFYIFSNTCSTIKTIYLNLHPMCRISLSSLLLVRENAASSVLIKKNKGAAK
jgi:hypothetical protein